MARLALALAALLLAAPATAADITVDVERGIVLASDEADAPRRPASLVKLMSARVAFAALESGEITDDTPVTISAKAARQPPVRLRLKRGDKIPFGELLAAMAIGSKNDAAVAVAEAVAGSEAAFVERMNAAARALGMVNTTYANPSGLPASGQVTTARDTAILALSLLTDHSERSALFAERSTRADARPVRTTNPLFGRVPGTRGMKTGFTCAAGYNIVGLVEREGRRVLAVTLGHRRKAARLAAARSLIAAAFDAPRTGPPLEAAERDPVPPPDVGACAGGALAAVSKEGTDDAWVPPPRPAARPTPPPRRVATLPPKPRPPARPTRPVPPPPPPLGGWAAFLGAFDSERAATIRLRAVTALAAGSATVPSRVFPRPRDGKSLGILYGLTRAQARALCARAKAARAYCLALAPAALLNPKARWRR